MNWQIWGIVAGTVTSAGFLPQIWRGYKTKHLKDMSYGMTGLLTIGFSMWLIYGLVKKDFAIIAANIAGITFNVVLMTMKIYYGKTSERLEKSH